ncbi:MAG: magnesium transporter [Lachnospiraceae bacterium]|jgi:magnesium transporter|nr:magnesium transporter [Lachnospiraceae bacterium]
MLVYKDNQEVEAKTVDLSSGGNYFYILATSELGLLDSVPDIKARIADGFNPDDCASKYECYDGHDMFYINIPPELQDDNSFRFMGAYISANTVLCVYEEWEDHPYLLGIIRQSMGKGMTAKKAVLSVIDDMTRDDFSVLGALEDKIEDIEDMVTRDEVVSGVEEITALRRKIQPMKRFFEHLLDAIEDLHENENGLFLDTDLKYASRIYGRVDRLYRNVINLRDYITQVREAYQSQIDIGLNNVMKTFTVITAIFLPLTLLAGWYGMNLIMPEFDWRYGYGFVIFLSILIITVCLIIFKKKKWY